MNGAQNAIFYRFSPRKEGGGKTKGVLQETEPQNCPLVMQCRSQGSAFPGAVLQRMHLHSMARDTMGNVTKGAVSVTAQFSIEPFEKDPQVNKSFQQLVPLEFPAGRVEGAGENRAGSTEKRGLEQSLEVEREPETEFRWDKGGEGGFFGSETT